MDLGKQLNLYHEIPVSKLDSRAFTFVATKLIEDININIKWPTYTAATFGICDQISATIWEPYNE